MGKVQESYLCLGSNVTVEAQKVSDVPSWLVELYDFYGRKEEFDMLEADFPGKYPDLVRLLCEADPSLVVAIPNRDLGVDENGQAHGLKVQFSPGFVYAFTKLKQNHRQVTLTDGGRIDIRNERWVSVVGVPVENLIADVRRDLDKLKVEGDLKARKSIFMDWRRILRAKRQMLPADLAARMDEEIAKPIVPIATL
jgi:hypothetical protein